MGGRTGVDQGLRQFGRRVARYVSKRIAATHRYDRRRLPVDRILCLCSRSCRGLHQGNRRTRCRRTEPYDLAERPLGVKRSCRRIIQNRPLKLLDKVANAARTDPPVIVLSVLTRAAPLYGVALRQDLGILGNGFRMLSGEGWIHELCPAKLAVVV